MYKKISLIAVTILGFGIPNQSNAMNNSQNTNSKQLFCKRTKPDGDMEIAKNLFSAGSFIASTLLFGPFCNQLPATQMQPLYDAIKIGDVVLFKQLYTKYCKMFEDSNMIKPDSNGHTLFEYAIEKRNEELTDLIIGSWQHNNRLFDSTNDKGKNNLFHRFFAMANGTSKKEAAFFSDNIKKLLNCSKSNYFYFEAKNNNGLTPLDIAYERKLEDALYWTILFLIKQNGPAVKANCEEFIIKQLEKAKKHGLWKLAAKLINHRPTVTLFESFYELVQQKSPVSISYFYKNLFSNGLKPNITIANGHEEDCKIVEQFKQELSKNTELLRKNLLVKTKECKDYTPKKPVGHDLKICFKK